MLFIPDVGEADLANCKATRYKYTVVKGRRGVENGGNRGRELR